MQKCRPRDHLRTVAAEGEEARARGVQRRNARGVRSLEKKLSAEKKRSRRCTEKKGVRRRRRTRSTLGSSARWRRRWGRSSAAVAAAALLGSAGDECEATARWSGARRRKLGQHRSEEEDGALKYTGGPLVPVLSTNRD